MLRCFTRFAGFSASKAIPYMPISALSSSSETSLLIGDPIRGQIDPVTVTWTDIIGDDCGGSSKRLAAGRILSVLDLCAGHATNRVMNKITQSTGASYSSCTVGVSGTVFVSPILHGDALRVRGSVIYCGESSLGIYIRFFRQSPSTKTEGLTGESFFTMVFITQDLKPARVVPAMTLTDKTDIEMHKRYNAIRSFQKQNAETTKKLFEHVVTERESSCPISEPKPLYVPISTTYCHANRIFFLGHLNNNNTVFGGELMGWMERHAVHCGRMFTGNRNIFTISMHSLSFDEPVYATDWVSLSANVIYVRNTTMEVDVMLSAERANGSVITNRASFVLINTNDIGQKISIPIGLDLSVASQDELKRYVVAKKRYQSGFENSKYIRNLV
ncbi:unnamed protein product [Phytomonas sp. Hart1]|nr:unnamed protein product [Phytomonas sp. Hart1]|eukprot:CCW67342.1 unnamed protein product [Phytomonas sp. isolate Hart1]